MGSDDFILVAIDSRYVRINKKVFVQLFDNSHVYYRQGYINALRDNKIRFNKLKELSRDAGIPYSLFFAPTGKVEENIKQNNDILFNGVLDVPISIASRGDVGVRDINLIIKDIQKRQQFLSNHNRDAEPNSLINLRREQEVVDMADSAIRALNLDMEKFRGCSNKGDAYEFLVSSLESKNIIVSRSRIGAMPQNIKKELMFSGFAVKHKKYPAIFLHSKDEDGICDPVGRRIFTIFLLLACMANKKFVLVSYDQSTKEPAQKIEYLVAEEMLMPEDAVTGIRINTIGELEDIANIFKVTPSMAAVRLKRLGCIDQEIFEDIFNNLETEWRVAKEARKEGFKYKKMKDVTRAISYNGKLFTTEVVGLLRSNKLSEGDALRLLFFRKKSKPMLKELLNRI